MFVNVNGPDIGNFDPLPFVRSWLAVGGRLFTSYKPGATSKSAKLDRLVHNWVKSRLRLVHNWVKSRLKPRK